jgi:tripartite-type tricarboxylate transporter receptor subunit TctC
MRLRKINKKKATAKLRLTKILATAFLACGIGLIAVVPSDAQSALSKKSPLQQGLAYYKGKTVVIACPSTPGGSYDEWARLVAPQLQAVLGATVEVTNNTGAGTIAGQDVVAHSVPNGLTIGQMTPTTDATNTIAGTTGVNFNAERVRFISAVGPSISIWASLADSGITSWASLIAQTTQVKEVATPGFVAYLEVLANDAFGINAEVLTAYPGAAQEEQGFVRGDGPVAETAYSTIASLIAGQKAIPLAISQKLPSGIQYRASTDVAPTIAELAKRYPPKTKERKQVLNALETMIAVSRQVFWVPTATPYQEVDALQYAFKKILLSPYTAKTALADGLAPGYQPGGLIKSEYLKLSSLAHVIAPLVQNV